MKIYRYISTTKAKDSGGKKPTHYLKAKENQTDKDSEFIASLWAKEYKNPDGTVSKFLSGEMKAQWTDHTDPSKSRKGFVIVEEAELNKLLKATAEPLEPEIDDHIEEEDIPF